MENWEDLHEAKEKIIRKRIRKQIFRNAFPVANLTSKILANLINQGFYIIQEKWTSELKAPSLTPDPAVSFSLAKKVKN